MSDLLLEIGTEEIPSRFMADSLRQLKENMTKRLDELRIEYTEVRSLGTPRRMVLYVAGLAEEQPDLIQENRGPSKKAAYDAEGRLSKAAEGFARSQNVKPEELFLRETENGEYLFAKKMIKGRKVSQIMEELLPEIVMALHFPKPMRWGSSSLRYVRPIRWLISLLGEEIIPFSIEECSSGRTSRGHRFLGKAEIVIPGAESYFSLLEENFVIVDPEIRKELITKQIEELASSLGGSIESDEELLEEIVYLVEYPTALAGGFAERYLEIPKEAVITPMKEHQRYFPIFNNKGELLPNFITVRNGDAYCLDVVRAGNEKVLEARLADARFFYVEDQKKPLAEFVPKLAEIVFQESLGSVLDKTERIRDNVRDLAEAIGVYENDFATALRAAYLAKADLMTNMVYEFPELQGIMGEKYALLSGEKPEVAKAIFEHYLPRNADDYLPVSLAGALVSLSDKLDTVAGCFSAGIEPTGSQDPYALRRQTAGICSIILDKGLNVSLRKLIRIALMQYKMIEQEKVKELEDKIYSFFEQRVRNILTEKGYRYDSIEAIMSEGYDNLVETIKRAEALEEIKNTPQFSKLLTAFTRANNLADKADNFEINETLLKEESEKVLYAALLEAEKTVVEEKGRKEFLNCLKAIAGLEEKINVFFESVMVMDKEQKIKENRLALLQRITALTKNIVNLNKIVQN